VGSETPRFALILDRPILNWCKGLVFDRYGEHSSILEVTFVTLTAPTYLDNRELTMSFKGTPSPSVRGAL
jgi:hypothetical protein